MKRDVERVDVQIVLFWCTGIMGGLAPQEHWEAGSAPRCGYIFLAQPVAKSAMVLRQCRLLHDRGRGRYHACAALHWAYDFH